MNVKTILLKDVAFNSNANIASHNTVSKQTSWILEFSTLIASTYCGLPTCSVYLSTRIQCQLFFRPLTWKWKAAGQCEPSSIVIWLKHMQRNPKKRIENRPLSRLPRFLCFNPVKPITQVWLVMRNEEKATFLGRI